MNKSSSVTLPKAVAPAQERKPLAPLPPQQRNGGYSNEDFSDTASGDSSLEGNIQLKVLLPDGTNVFMAVERRYASDGLIDPRCNGAQIDCKASTPIGSLNTSCIHLVPKRNDVPSKKMPKQAQPFEQTFRLQVHLPRQQLVVVRVSPHARLADIFSMVCQQKELDPSRYLLQHPTSSEVQLDPNRCLADYNLTEINVVSKRASLAIPSRQSANVEFHREELEEKKPKQIFGLMFRRSKSSVGDSSSDEYNSRGCSPTTETDHHHRPESGNTTETTKKVVKKRAAPLPPSTKPKSHGDRPPPPPPLHKTTKSYQNEQSHSRHSSDSSGYHESSVLGDECPEIETTRSASNLSSTASTSNTSIVSGIKKRKAPLPPITKKVVNEETTTQPQPQPQPRLSKLEIATEETTIEEFSTFSPPPFDSPPSPLEIPSPDTRLEEIPNEMPPSDDKVFDDISEEPEPVPEPTLETECHDPSSHEHPILACDEIDQSSFGFDIPDISVDKYREEETSGSCSRSDTHTTDSAVADLDLDASGSSSWSPIPEMKPTFPKEIISVSAVVHYEEKREIAEVDESGGNDDVLKVADEEYAELNGKYDWFSSSQTITDSNHDDWIKSSSDDEQDTLEALSSPSSYYSIEDVAASFEQVIADAELALKKDLEEKVAEEKPKVVMGEEKPKFFRRMRPLVNFSIDTYKSRNDDPSTTLGYSESFAEPKPKQEVEVETEAPAKRVIRSSSLHEKNIAQNIQFKMVPYDNMARQNSQVDEPETKTNLATKSKSLVNLLDNDTLELKKSNSEQRVNSVDDQTDSPEYLKLQQQQQQLIYWQQQLMSNQALLKQHIVPENMVKLAPEVVDLLQNNLQKQISSSTNDLDEVENDYNVPLRKSETAKRIDEQHRAKSCVDLSPVQPFSQFKTGGIGIGKVSTNTADSGKVSTNTTESKTSTYTTGNVKKSTKSTLFRVESMKNEEKVEKVDKIEFETKKESVLPSIKGRISLFLGKKNESDESESPHLKNEEKKFNTSFERGLLARKPIKMSNFSNAANNKEAEVQSHSKFRRQRIMPNYLDNKESGAPIEECPEKSKPACNGHVVKDYSSKPESKPIEVTQVRKPRLSRPMVFTYFGDSVNGNEPNRKEENQSAINKTANNQSAITKVATSEVLALPSLPSPVLHSVVEKSDIKSAKNPPLVLKKPLQSKGSNGANRFATAPNPRDTLMDSIRSFGGRNKLRQVPRSETYWHSWHGEVA
uniref:WH2 domain-containing protein n=1 Tax=Strigamia maritima TaxID=126957 RepID=T1JAJ6_STRMM